MAVKVLVMFLAITICAAQVEHYKTLNDDYDPRNVSIQEIAGLVNCLTDKGPCSDLHASFKDSYPSVVTEACARCNPAHKLSLCRFITRAMKELPKEFKVFLNKYDPEKKYFDKFYKVICEN